MATMTHPTRNIRIDYQDTIAGYRGTLTDEAGDETPVKGTWALGPALSFATHTHTTPNGFEAGDYVVVCGHWQI